MSAPAGYSLLKWPKVQPDDDGSIYWHIVNFTSKMDKFKCILAFEHCFNEWQDAFDSIEPVGRAITFKPTNDYHKAHIKIYFLNPGERKREFTLSDGSKVGVENKWPFEGPQGVLAHRPPGKFEIHFDESEEWSEIHKVESKDGKHILHVQLWQVAMHELGHVLDIGHSRVEEAIMYPTYDGVHTKIVQDDLDGLAAAWSKTKQRFAHLIPPAAITTDFTVQHFQDALPKKSAYKKRALDGIKQIAIHHSADNGTIESIARYHVSKGWPGIGYAYVIYKDGTIYHTNDIDEACYNVANQNSKTLGICLIGDYEKETPPDIQVKAAKWLVKTLKAVIGDVEVVGHRDRTSTLCPGENLYRLIKDF